jgi:hypothetical protein
VSELTPSTQYPHAEYMLLIIPTLKYKRIYPRNILLKLSRMAEKSIINPIKIIILLNRQQILKPFLFDNFTGFRTYVSKKYNLTNLAIKRVYVFSLARTFFHASIALLGQGLLLVETSRSHSDTTRLVGLLWTSDRPVA